MRGVGEVEVDGGRGRGAGVVGREWWQRWGGRECGDGCGDFDV